VRTDEERIADAVERAKKDDSVFVGGHWRHVLDVGWSQPVGARGEAGA
jgi:hypothetical protein